MAWSGKVGKLRSADLPKSFGERLYLGRLVSGGQGDAEAGLAAGDGGIADGRDEKTAGAEGGGGFHSAIFIAEDDGHDGGGRAASVRRWEERFRERIRQKSDVFPQSSAGIVSR